MSIAPGWYPDPLVPAGARWWSGQAWTETVHRTPQQPVPFSPPPVVPQHVAVNPWSAPHAWPPPPQRTPGWMPWLVGSVVGLVVLGLVVAGAQVAFGGGGGGAARTAATGYLQALERGDTAAAYQSWCTEDRAAYPEAVFRAQHEWHAGHHSRVVSALSGGLRGSDRASVVIRNDEGFVQDLPLERTAGRWEVCPRGDRLQGDMQNCGCMTPGQKLEADIAHVVAPRAAKYPFVQVTCPALPALVDGKAVRCTAAAADGRAWVVTATESGSATRTDVRIEPAGTGG